jgi:predicted Zn-dependent protease
MMRTKFILTLLASCVLTACVKSPTGRTQFMMMPDAQMDQMGLQAFDKLKQSKPVSQNSRYTRFVNCIAQPITQQVGGGQWEIVVFEDPELNAFALPGNKVGVYTGLINMVDNQHQLAAVIGHEIGHVIAKHSNERLSQETAVGQTMDIVKAIAGAPQSALGQVGMAALGLGVEYGVLLPYSRTQESEADVIGLELMAKSGFNPNQSISLWQKMSQATQGQTPPEFMSTHPASASRIDDLNKNMPKAMQYYQQAQAAGRHPKCSK